MGGENTKNQSHKKKIHTKKKFFFFCEIWVVTIQHHQQGMSSQDPGRSGGEGERKESRRFFNTTNEGLCSMSTSNFGRDKFSTERRQRRKRNHREIKRKNYS